jgi:hypothetical protein
MTFYVAQFQPHTEQVEILWECATEQQAQDASDRLNNNLDNAGIPSTYWSFVTT